MQLFRSIALAATVLLAIGHISTANAQTTTQSVEPSSSGKGIVGGTLLGAEVVLLTEAAFDVSPDWLYYVGGGAGAIGGGIAGYYLEGSGGLSAKGNMYLLAAGMLLAIPTTVAVLSATAYEQPAEYTQISHPRTNQKRNRYSRSHPRLRRPPPRRAQRTRRPEQHQRQPHQRRSPDRKNGDVRCPWHSSQWTHKRTYIWVSLPSKCATCTLAPSLCASVFSNARSCVYPCSE
ncbi:MAG: hypothetical protein QM784_20065 [Polyangiaceae bacterium]